MKPDVPFHCRSGPHPRSTSAIDNRFQQDCQKTLLKAKYCPQRTHKEPFDLDLRPMTLLLNWLLKVVKLHVHAKFHQAKCSGS